MQLNRKKPVDIHEQNSQETNYVDLHEELTKRKRESKLVEESLYQVVQKDKFVYNQQQQEKLQRTQSLKKFYASLKHLNPFRK